MEEALNAATLVLLCVILMVTVLCLAFLRWRDDTERRK